MKKLFTILLLFSVLVSKAQYTTPNTGVNWTLDSLVTHSAGAVVWQTDHYRVTSMLTVSVDDTLSILNDATVIFDDLTGVYSDGTLLVNPPNQIYFTASDSTSSSKWRGFRLQADNVTLLRKATFEFSGGVKVIDGTITIDSCTFYKNFYKSGSTAGSFASGGVIDISGKGSITNSTFKFNQRSAISSGANVSTPLWIYNNYMFGNTTDNTNRPQINLGPSGIGDTTFIIKNTIIGNGYTNSGGIAYSQLLGGAQGVVYIDSNNIDKNRYGITVTGAPINAFIRYNTITDNNIQNNPNLGGSGINLTASSASAVQNVYVEKNVCSGNLWGITIVGYPKMNAGNTDPDNFNPGGNKFSNNMNGGVKYDLYNNGPNEQFAMYNCWDVATQDSVSIEGVVTHFNDDATYGVVHFMPSCSYMSNFVVKNQDGQLLEGAIITFENSDIVLTTDQNGEASTMLPFGENNLTAQSGGYIYQGSVNVTEDSNNFEIIITFQNYQINIHVFDEFDPVENASVSLNSVTQNTNASGLATFNEPNGSYEYLVTKPGYYNKSGIITVSNANVDENVQINKLPDTIFNLTFVVKDANNNLLKNVNIDINNGHITLVTNNQGTATTELPNGTYNYIANHNGYESASGTVIIDNENVTENITLILLKYQVKFIVKFDNGTPVQGVPIVINDTTITTNTEGIALINLENGTYQYSATYEQLVIQDSITVESIDLEENIIISTVGINIVDADYVLYPNPVNNILYFKNFTPDKVEIYNLNGKLVFKELTNNNFININSLKPGVYIIKMYNKNLQHISKIIKN